MSNDDDIVEKQRLYILTLEKERSQHIQLIMQLTQLRANPPVVMNTVDETVQILQKQHEASLEFWKNKYKSTVVSLRWFIAIDVLLLLVQLWRYVEFK